MVNERASRGKKRKVLSEGQIHAIKMRSISVSMTDNSPRSMTSDSGIESPEPPFPSDLRFTDEDFSGMRDLNQGIDLGAVLRENGIETDGRKRRSQIVGHRQEEPRDWQPFLTCSLLCMLLAFLLEMVGIDVINPTILLPFIAVAVVFYVVLQRMR